MTPANQNTLARPAPALLILFAVSGAAALIYEVVWLQLLQLVIGSSAVSIAVLLGTYMGGMCLGSLLLARAVPSDCHPLRVFAVLESGTAACGLLVLYGVPLIENLYLSAIAWGLPNTMLRGVACAFCLLPPTLLMGATLPAISRWVAATPEAPARWGYFYGANIAGGVVGCFAAGFYLLRIHDMVFATYAAAGLNLFVALVALAAARNSKNREAPRTSIKCDGEETVEPLDWPVYLAIGLSGLTALGAEVVWTRILSLMLGPTVYTFSIILGVFLIGLGIGGGVGSRIAQMKNNPRLWLGASQLLLCVTIAWAAFMLADSLPYWQGNVNSTNGLWKDFLGDVFRSAIAILPSALLWGRAFPWLLPAFLRMSLIPRAWWVEPMVPTPWAQSWERSFLVWP